MDRSHVLGSWLTLFRDEPGPMRDAMSTTVVFFLGGCTYTEIAALRWMNSQMKGTSRAWTQAHPFQR
jgi:hypothetical protein